MSIYKSDPDFTLAQCNLAQARYRYLVARLRLQSLAGEDRAGTIAQASSALAP